MHAFKTTFSIIPTLFLIACSTSSNSSWMADSSSQLSRKYLSQIIIPGTHYSNAYGLAKSTNLNVCSGETLVGNISNNAKIAQLVEQGGDQADFLNYLNTQDHDISQQLNNGIRYLELEVCLQNSTYYTANYYLTAKLEKVLQQIKAFIQSNPQEIIFIDLDNNLRAEYGYMTATDINQLHNLLQLQFGSYLTPKQNWQQLTMAKMWETKHRIILLSANLNLSNYYDVWDKNQLVTQPESANYTTIKKLTSIQEYLQSESTPTIPQNLSIIPIYSLFNPGSNNLSVLHSNSNQRLIMDYLYTLPQTTRLNIIVSDHQYNRQLVDFARQKNFDPSE